MSAVAIKDARTMYPRCLVVLQPIGGCIRWRAYYGRTLAGEGWVKA